VWKRILGVVVVAGVLGALLWYSQWRAVPRTVSGLIDADEIRVGSRIGGRVQQVLVEEGQSVSANDVLVQLDPFDLVERQAQATYQLAAAKAAYDERLAGYRVEDIAQAKARRDNLAATLDKLVKGPREQDIAAARAELDLAKARRELAQSTHDRVSTALAQGAATDSEMDQAIESLKVAEATVTARQEALNQLLEGTRPEDIVAARASLEQADQQWQQLKNGYRREEIAQAKASMDAAEAALQIITKQMDELTIRAPADSVVEAIDLEPGDLIGPNAPALSLLDLNSLWVRAYIPETALDLNIGNRLWIYVDAYPNEHFIGHVIFIAREAEFTPRNVQTPEERSKQVYRIKVQIDEGLDRLRPGMFADVHLDERPPAGPASESTTNQPESGG